MINKLKIIKISLFLQWYHHDLELTVWPVKSQRQKIGKFCGYDFSLWFIIKTRFRTEVSIHKKLNWFLNFSHSTRVLLMCLYPKKWYSRESLHLSKSHKYQRWKIDGSLSERNDWVLCRDLPEVLLSTFKGTVFGYCITRCLERAKGNLSTLCD